MRRNTRIQWKLQTACLIAALTSAIAIFIIKSIIAKCLLAAVALLALLCFSALSPKSEKRDKKMPRQVSAKTPVKENKPLQRRPSIDIPVDEPLYQKPEQSREEHSAQPLHAVSPAAPQPLVVESQKPSESMTREPPATETQEVPATVTTERLQPKNEVVYRQAEKSEPKEEEPFRIVIPKHDPEVWKNPVRRRIIWPGGEETWVEYPGDKPRFEDSDDEPIEETALPELVSEAETEQAEAVESVQASVDEPESEVGAEHATVDDAHEGASEVPDDAEQSDEDSANSEIESEPLNTDEEIPEAEEENADVSGKIIYFPNFKDRLEEDAVIESEPTEEPLAAEPAATPADRSEEPDGAALNLAEETVEDALNQAEEPFDASAPVDTEETDGAETAVDTDEPADAVEAQELPEPGQVIHLPEALDNWTTDRPEPAGEAEPAAGKPHLAEKSRQQYVYPPFSLLEQPQECNESAADAELQSNAERLAATLVSFGVEATAGDAVRGPSVTRYEFTLEPGVKLSKVTNLQDDIALALGAAGVRVAPIQDKQSVVGIEVPNRTVSPVAVRTLLESPEFLKHRSTTAFAVGEDISGRRIVGDISRFPHVLIAGTTGSGKSVCTNSLIVSILFKSTPEEVRFIMVDPKMVELAPYNGIPHLLIPVVTDPKKAAGALQWAVYEMMKRYKLFSEHGVKDLTAYNALADADDSVQKLPSVVVVIDELADLMLIAAKEVEESICRVAQMGRAAGMHLVIATQSPRADVITGLMKANIPSRIAFAVASSLESRIILDNVGAEKLVGKGDMLYAPLGQGKPQRVQGCFISASEIERVVTFLKANGEADYDESVIEQIERTVAEKENKESAPAEGVETDPDDELFDQAVEVILETGQASTSMLQRRLKLGYSRAARIVDQMEERGVVGPFEGSKPRKILITRESWANRKQIPSGDEPD